MRTPEYSCWNHMIQRCTNPKVQNYPRYGGAGITVCDAWLKSFAAFFAHIGQRPGDNYSIDRIDNSRGYEPGNVRWATARQQQQNTKRTVRITAFGETHSVAEWARIKGIGYSTLLARLNDYGWSPERAISTVPDKTAGRFRPASLLSFADAPRASVPNDPPRENMRARILQP